MVIVVKDFINQDAEVLYSNISNNLKRDVKITLDFKAIEKTTYEFLEDTIGKIIEEHGFETVQDVIKFRNVDTGIKEMLSKLIKDINKK
jgi:uncharacterized protein YaaW (UPF0174 family)